MNTASIIKITVGPNNKNKKEFFIYPIECTSNNIIKSDKYFQNLDDLVKSLSHYQKFNDIVIEDVKNTDSKTNLDDYCFLIAKSVVADLDFGVLFKKNINSNHIIFGLWPKELYEAALHKNNPDLLHGFLLKILYEPAFFKYVEIHKCAKQFYRPKEASNDAIIKEICPFCRASLSPARVENLKSGRDTFCPKCLKVILP